MNRGTESSSSLTEEKGEDWVRRGFTGLVVWECQSSHLIVFIFSKKKKKNKVNNWKSWGKKIKGTQRERNCETVLPVYRWIDEGGGSQSGLHIGFTWGNLTCNQCPQYPRTIKSDFQGLWPRHSYCLRATNEIINCN